MMGGCCSSIMHLKSMAKTQASYLWRNFWKLSLTHQDPEKSRPFQCTFDYCLMMSYKAFSTIKALQSICMAWKDPDLLLPTRYRISLSVFYSYWKSKNGKMAKKKTKIISAGFLLSSTGENRELRAEQPSDADRNGVVQGGALANQSIGRDYWMSANEAVLQPGCFLFFSEGNH